ncbi:MAG: hypothetical protein ACI4QB_03355 [Eubacteriales bacterium]
MTKKRWLILAVAAAVVSLIGLAAYFGGVRRVNPGAFFFPAVIALWAHTKYRTFGKK